MSKLAYPLGLLQISLFADNIKIRKIQASSIIFMMKYKVILKVSIKLKLKSIAENILIT